MVNETDCLLLPFSGSGVLVFQPRAHNGNLGLMIEVGQSHTWRKTKALSFESPIYAPITSCFPAPSNWWADYSSFSPQHTQVGRYELINCQACTLSPAGHHGSLIWGTGWRLSISESKLSALKSFIPLWKHGGDSLLSQWGWTGSTSFSILGFRHPV